MASGFALCISVKLPLRIIQLSRYTVMVSVSGVPKVRSQFSPNPFLNPVDVPLSHPARPFESLVSVKLYHWSRYRVKFMGGLVLGVAKVDRVMFPIDPFSEDNSAR